MFRAALDSRVAVGHRKRRIVWGHEMMIKRVLTIAVLVGSLGMGAAQAQIREQQPAEFPPSSYKGKQYVDSKGCVFIRAGIDGNVSWIPRVTRARKTVCGFAPSIPGQVATAPVVAPAKVEQITLNNTTAVAPVVAKPAPRQVTRPRKTAPAIVRQTKRAPVRQVATAPVIVANDQATYAPAQYNTSLAATPQVTQQTRIVPKHVAYNRLNTRNVVVPKGYKRVWDDGRLNPYRAEQTLAGRNQMLLVWTQTVPRRLIDSRTGRDVTTSVPLIYPYIDVFTQTKELGQVTLVQRDGQIAKRVVRNSKSRKPVFSSRSAPKAEAAKPAPGALAGKRYVQIGTFGKTANAQNSAQKIAQMGYPARIGKHRKSGKSFLTVQAGPFNDVSALQSAIKRLRSAGYADAFARN